jgi:biopolymer transport protein ExbD
MSHGNLEKAEPNLVPLLDLVLQLVMFFMVCANFVMEQVNETIKLPEAVVGKPLDRKDESIIFLNVDKKGEVILSALEAAGGPNPLTNPEMVRIHMSRRYKEDIRAAGGDESQPPRSVVILRVDRECPFEKTYAIMRAVRLAKYERVQLRVRQFGGQLKS